MKNLILIPLFLFYLPVSAQQFDYPIKEYEPAELILSYSLDYIMDTLNPDNIYHAEMCLFLGQTMSKFQDWANYRYDTIMRNVSNSVAFQKLLLDQNRPFPKFSYQLFKDHDDKEITFIKGVPSFIYLYKGKLDLFDWHLTGDTANIKGYKAQKAICDFGGRSWVAWFTPEIPYSDGPYKFNGLPGLILNVHDTESEYVFEFESIEKPGYELMIDRREKDFVETTKFEFFRVKDSFYENIISNAKEAGLSGSSQQRAAQNAAKMNNRIELIRE